ncbi:MAG: ribonuclease P protein component [Muribaculaceae bacterium]
MTASSLRLYKKQKLCSPTAIDRLFGRAGVVTRSAISYPLRAVWMHNAERRSDAELAFLISVPKKRLRHAVDRVTMRRRIREAYRLCYRAYVSAEPVSPERRIDVAFIYVATELRPYADVARAVSKLMTKITAAATEPCQ